MKRILFTSAVLVTLFISSCAASVTSTISNANTPILTTQPQTTSLTAITPASTQSTTSISITSNPTRPELNVHFLNVGEGDAILIDYGTTDVLIDGGEATANVANLIKPYVHGDLEAVIATHYHSDHIGGQAEVFKDNKVDNVFWNGESDATQTYLNWRIAMDRSGASEHIVRRGDVINEGGLTFNVLDPLVITDADPDQDCIVLSLQYGSKSFLFMADDGKPAEDNLLAAGLLKHYSVLKVGHHGSDTATSQEFVDVVKPDIAVYECGLNDQYGFPKADVIARLKQEGAAVSGTNTSGNIEINTDGTAITIGHGGTLQSPVPVSSPAITTSTSSTDNTSSALQVISVTSPISPGGSATLVAKTTPGALCSITVNYKSGPSTAGGLGPKTADDSGNVSWTWQVGARTTAGTWQIVVRATSQGSTTTATTSFTVN